MNAAEVIYYRLRVFFVILSYGGRLPVLIMTVKLFIRFVQVTCQKEEYL